MTIGAKNPWDIAPLPNKGDATSDITAAAKGYATSTWELLEVELSHLYAQFVGGPYDDLKVMAGYGKKLNFKDRLRDLGLVAEKFFSLNPCQIKEADFDDIFLLSSQLCARRNDIVHSVIRPVLFERSHEFTQTGASRWTFRHHFYLVPPTYTDRKYDHKNQPAFIYTSVEVEAYAAWFTMVKAAALNLVLRYLDPSEAPYGRKHASPSA